MEVRRDKEDECQDEAFVRCLASPTQYTVVHPRGAKGDEAQLLPRKISLLSILQV